MYQNTWIQLTLRTFKVKENIWLVVFEHLGHQFHIHILNVDFLLNANSIRDCSTDHYIFMWNDTWRLLFSTIIASLSFSYWNLSVIPVCYPEQAWARTMLVMIRESSWICWCSWGLSWRFLYQSSSTKLKFYNKDAIIWLTILKEGYTVSNQRILLVVCFAPRSRCWYPTPCTWCVIPIQRWQCSAKPSAISILINNIKGKKTISQANYYALH